MKKSIINEINKVDFSPYVEKAKILLISFLEGKEYASVIQADFKNYHIYVNPSWKLFEVCLILFNELHKTPYVEVIFTVETKDGGAFGRYSVLYNIDIEFLDEYFTIK